VASKWTSNRLLGVCLLTACLLAAGSAAAGELKLFEAVEPHMGTLARIQLYAAGEAQAKAAFRAAFDRIAQLDGALSDYKPESELNRLTLTAARRPVRASADLFEVLRASQKLAAETGGAFDITLGPVIRLWREARKEGRLPDEANLREAAVRCGYQKLHLDIVKQTVWLDQPGMQLDLGAIAKGYAADAALEVLKRLGITRALVAISGDLAMGDPPPGRRGWRIGVQDRVLELSNTAVSTSGDVEQHLQAGGKRYSHIVDPATRTGLTSRIAVTVVTRRGIDADSLSTAASVLGPDRGLQLIERRAAAGLIMIGERTVQSSRWKWH
jgi:FAD:protein FMN transferase